MDEVQDDREGGRVQRIRSGFEAGVNFSRIGQRRKSTPKRRIPTGIVKQTIANFLARKTYVGVGGQTNLSNVGLKKRKSEQQIDSPAKARKI